MIQWVGLLLLLLSNVAQAETSSEIGFYARPNFLNTTLDLFSTGTEFKLSGFSPINPGIYLRHTFNNDIGVEVNAWYQTLSLDKGLVDHYALNSSEVAYFGGSVLVTRCFDFESGSSLCPRAGLAYDANYYLEFETNSSLRLAKFGTYLLDAGLSYTIPLTEKGTDLTLTGDYRPGIALGQQGSVLVQSYTLYHFQSIFRIPLKNPAWNFLVGGIVDLRQTHFTVVQDEWNQNFTGISAMIGIEIHTLKEKENL